MLGLIHASLKQLGTNAGGEMVLASGAWLAAGAAEAAAVLCDRQ